MTKPATSRAITKNRQCGLVFTVDRPADARIAIGFTVGSTRRRIGDKGCYAPRVFPATPASRRTA